MSGYLVEILLSDTEFSKLAENKQKIETTHQLIVMKHYISRQDNVLDMTVNMKQVLI